jgi:hypothetical protein
MDDADVASKMKVDLADNIVLILKFHLARLGSCTHTPTWRATVDEI